MPKNPQNMKTKGKLIHVKIKRTNKLLTTTIAINNNYQQYEQQYDLY